jgi:hypothetical protein
VQAVEVASSNAVVCLNGHKRPVRTAHRLPSEYPS